MVEGDGVILYCSGFKIDHMYKLLVIHSVLMNAFTLEAVAVILTFAQLLL